MTGADASVAVVSQRLCNLLLSFPEAAIAGVQWSALQRKYEERHAQRLDLQALGHDSALAAATALLWDVGMVVNSEDLDNPIVALEEQAAMSPQPGLLGCWPSLYEALCDVALANGSPEPDGASALLMSQLKPLLEKRWHASFEENGLGYLTAEGSFVKLKKMKHLVQAVIGWREQQVAWRLAEGRGSTAIDEALAPALELAASARHNDLILRCSPKGCAAQQAAPTADAARPLRAGCKQAARPAATPMPQPQPARAAPSAAPAAERAERTAAPAAERAADEREALQRELAALRAENAALRGRNQQLEVCAVAPLAAPQPGLLCRPVSEPFGPSQQADSCPQLHDVFDDPFEPPPEAACWKERQWGAAGSPSPSSRTSCGGSLAWDTSSSICGGSEFGDGAETPLLTRMSSFDIAGSKVPSGSMTPRDPSMAMGEAGGTFMPVPMWWTLVPTAARGALEIPCGIVQSMRAHFEQVAGAQQMQ